MQYHTRPDPANPGHLMSCGNMPSARNDNLVTKEEIYALEMDLIKLRRNCPVIENGVTAAIAALRVRFSYWFAP